MSFQPYGVKPPVDDDYKAEAIYQRDKADYESQEKWLYLGADTRNAAYAKIGITMQEMTSPGRTAQATPIFICSAPFNALRAQLNPSSKKLSVVFCAI